MFSRRQFIQSCLAIPIFARSETDGHIITVTGRIPSAELGQTLIHEHVLVDFIGADKISSDRWKHEDVIRKVLPFLLEIKERGIKSLLECTPAYIGRDVRLLEKLSALSGLRILTNTGFYGASNNKYLPSFAFTESAEALAARWIAEFRNGIDGTSIRPGFIKIGVNPGALSDLHKKLINAAALAHLGTGLTICSHTGAAQPAHQQLEILKAAGVSPRAFVWVHADGSVDDFIRIVKSGCWISLDGISENNLAKNANTISLLKANGMLEQVLISHDAGWYRPGEPNGGTFKGFTTITDKFLPLLLTKGFTDQEIKQLIAKNPANAFIIKIRKAG